MPRKPLPPSLPPRGICREEAAAYIGVGTTSFDKLVSEGAMPRPKVIGGRRVWDVHALDRAFSALPGDGDANPWDAAA
jgi:predicted DNA-binding transcriptional regulator AlpA